MHGGDYHQYPLINHLLLITLQIFVIPFAADCAAWALDHWAVASAVSPEGIKRSACLAEVITEVTRKIIRSQIQGGEVWQTCNTAWNSTVKPIADCT